MMTLLLAMIPNIKIYKLLTYKITKNAAEFGG